MRRCSSLILIGVLLATVPGCMHRRSVAVSRVDGSRTESPRTDPGSPTALSNFIQSTLKISRENTAAAENALNELLKRKPELAGLAKRAASSASDVEARRLLADAYLEAGLLPYAFQMYQEIKSIRPGDSAAELGVARVWDRWGDFGLALQHAERAVLLDPRSSEALEALGRVHLHQNSPDQALSAFLSALAIKPMNAPLMTNVGYTYLKRGDLTQARRYLERSIAVDDSIAQSHNNLGIVYARIGEPDRALREFMAVNEPAAAFNNLGAVYFEQKQWRAARDAFRKALSLDPGYKKAQSNLAEAEAHMPPPAIINLPAPSRQAEIALAPATGPRSVKADLQRAAAQSQGREIKKDASRIAVAYSDALQRFRRRHYKEAIDIFQWLLRQYPNDTLASNCEYWIGESFFGLADYKSAYNAFKRVTTYSRSLKKSDALVMMRRAAIKQRRAGRTTKA